MASNLQLFNLLTRHQIYVEGVKAGEANNFDRYLRELDDDIKLLFSGLEFETLDAMTKRELRSFLRDVEEVQKDVYNQYTNDLVKTLTDFMAMDVDVTLDIYKGDSVDAEEGDGDEALFGLLGFTGTAEGDKSLWSTTTNNPIPAVGMLIIPFINGFTESSSERVKGEIVKGYSNRLTPKQTLNAIRGTKAKNFRDGDFAKIKRNNRAVINTAMQHVDSIVQAGIASLFYNRYQWVSVLDGKTSEICLSRAGKIFNFGAGPLPPAHINCRSKIVPTNKKQEDFKQSYYAWIKLQPTAVQNDILGVSKAKALRKGTLTSKDLPKFVGAKPISIEEFGNKRQLMQEK